MSVDKITTTPTPLALVDKINELVGDYLPSDAKAALAALADKATADASGNTITSTYATKAQAITGLSASGTTVTYTKGDGSTGTITTQDTDTKYTLPTASSSTLGGIKVGSGLSISSGVLSASGGTISASSLGTNGYVKFSNGLILQWGTGTGLGKDTNVSLIFPISFSTVAIAVSQSVPAASSWSYAQVSVSNTTLVVQSQGIYRERVWWLAMGI